MKKSRAFALCLATVSLMLPVETSAQRGSPAVPHVRTVHVSAVDRKETPVTDLTATDFVLREGGDVREIIRVEPATAPLHIAIIVDDSGTGIFRVPIANFVNQLLGRAQFAVQRITCWKICSGAAPSCMSSPSRESRS